MIFWNLSRAAARFSCPLANDGSARLRVGSRAATASCYIAEPLPAPSMVFMLTSAGGLAWGGAGELRCAAERGVASVAAPFEARQWGSVGGGSAAFGLADQLWLELDADHSEMA